MVLYALCDFIFLDNRLLQAYVARLNARLAQMRCASVFLSYHAYTHSQDSFCTGDRLILWYNDAQIHTHLYSAQLQANIYACIKLS